MTEFTDEETKELIKFLDEIEKNINEARPKCTEKWQIEILDEIEKILHKKKE